LNPQRLIGSGFAIPAIRMLTYWRTGCLAPAAQIDVLYAEIIEVICENQGYYEPPITVEPVLNSRLAGSIAEIQSAGGTGMTTGNAIKAAIEPTNAPIAVSANPARLQGVLLVLVSAAVFSCAGLFVKGVAADSWTILFWRGWSSIVFTLVYVCWRRGLRREFLQMGKPGVSAAMIGALATAAFIPAFKYTSIANVSLIYAAVPFVATAIAWLWMREKPALVVLLASLAAFSGVLIIVSGSLASVNLRGDILALAMTVGMAAFLCIYRRYPQTPAAGPAMLSSLLLMPPALLLGEPFAIPLHETLLSCGFGLVFAVASVTMAEGARRLPAAETALISALETPLAPLWAYLVLSELPNSLTVLGGAVILLAVFGAQLYAARRKPQGV
jgi:drug/metabolite transporter (DMT)-like permease